MVLIYIYISLLVKVSQCINFTVDNRYSDTEDCLISQGRVPCHSLEYISSFAANKSGVLITVTSSIIYMNGTANFSNVNGIRITGSEQTTISCMMRDGTYSAGSSLLFFGSSNINLTRLTFFKCTGNSTFEGPDIYIYLYAILICRSTNVTISNIVVTSSHGYGLILMNVKNTVSITASEFSYNSNKDMSFRFHSGGMLIVLNKHHHAQTNYHMFNISFLRNEAYWDSEPITYKNVRQGGGLHISLYTSKNSFISICKVVFQSNTALYGGGLFILHKKRSSNNTIVIANSTFQQNLAYKGGGGSDIGFEKSIENEDIPFNNSITFLSCEWIENYSLDFGGGGSIFTSLVDLYSHAPKSTEINQIEFKRCCFKKNHATGGAAIKLAPTLKRSNGRDIFIIVTFEECIFQENDANDKHKKLYPDGAIVLTSGIWISFQSETRFESNLGTALLISSTTAVFVDSNTTFNKNKAERGGAVYLMKKSYIELVEGNNFTFTNNKAMFGGAILATQTHQYDFQFMDTCFLKGKRELATFLFTNNKAELGFGNDMFIFNLIPCLRHTECGNVSQLFRKNCIGNFTFSDQSVTTLPRTLVPEDNTIHPVPGKEMSFKVQQLDQFNIQNNFLMLTLQITPINTSIQLKSSSVVNSKGQIVFTGNPGSKAFMTIETVFKSTEPKTINISMNYCYPGFIYNQASFICECSDIQNSKSYPGVPRCINEAALLSVGYWAGFLRMNDSSNHNKKETFVTSKCLPSLCTFTSSKMHMGLLKINHDYRQLEEDICSKNRCGVLCSMCCNNTSVYYNSPTYLCKTNEHCSAGIGYFLLYEIIPTTCLFLAILFFNINLTSGSVYTMVFYVQILDSFSVDAFSHLKFNKFIQYGINAYRILYGVANMRFFKLEAFSFCIWKNANTLDIITLKYIVTGYAIILIFGTIALLKAYSLYMCIKVCKKCGRKNIRYSVVHSLSAFLIICYFHIIQIFNEIIRCTELKKSGGETVRVVAMFNGHIKCHSSKHLKYFVPAIPSLFLIALPPIVLILEPVLLKISSRFELNWRFTSQAFNRLRMLLKPFLDSFQGCFKNNCRVFAGFFFIYRIILGEWLIYVTNIYTQYSYTMITIIAIIIIHIIARPFAIPWHNKLDLFLLVNMLCIILLSYFNVSTNSSNPNSTASNLIALTQLLLASAPFIYIFIYLVRPLLKKFKIKYFRKTVQDEQLFSVSQEVIFARLEENSFHDISYNDIEES